jgi:hypothetical protein
MIGIISLSLLFSKVYYVRYVKPSVDDHLRSKYAIARKELTSTSCVFYAHPLNKIVEGGIIVIEGDAMQATCNPTSKNAMACNMTYVTKDGSTDSFLNNLELSKEDDVFAEYVGNGMLIINKELGSFTYGLMLLNEEFLALKMCTGFYNENPTASIERETVINNKEPYWFFNESEVVHF